MLRYTFGGTGTGYAEISVNDRSAFGDLSADLSAYAGKDRDGRVDPAVTSPNGLAIVRASAGTSVATHDSDYALDVRLPLGRPDQTDTAATNLLFHHATSLVDESVTGPAADTSPYLYDSRDLVDEEVLQLDHRLGSGLLALQYDDRNESLVTYAAHSGNPARRHQPQRRLRPPVHDPGRGHTLCRAERRRRAKRAPAARHELHHQPHPSLLSRALVTRVASDNG